MSSGLPTAMAAFRAGDYQRAATAANGADDAASRHLLAFARDRQADPTAEAPAVDGELVDLPPAPVLASYASFLDDIAAYGAALAFYDLALARQPGLTDASIDRALVLKHAGRLQDARNAYAALAELHPRHGRLIRNFAALLVQMDERQEAEKLLQGYVASAPSDHRAQWRLGRLLKDRGEPALSYLANARKLDPRQPQYHLDEAAAKVTEGRAEEGIAQLAALVRANPLWQDGHRTLAELRWQAGIEGAADKSYRDAVSRNPASIRLWTDWIRLIWRTQGYAAGEDVIAAALQANVGSPEIRRLRAVAHSESGNAANLTAEFETLDDGSDAGFRLDHVRFRLRTGDLDTAERLCRHLIDVGAGSHAWPYMDTVWRLRGDPRAEWLFGPPELISYIDLGWSRADLDILTGVIRGLHKARRQPIAQSVRGGTQTMDFLFARQELEIQRLKQTVLSACESYLAAWPSASGDQGDHPLLSSRHAHVRPIGAWSVRLVGGGYHTSHYHNEGWISSACHLCLPGGQGSDTESGRLVLGQPPAELGLDLPALREITPKEGHLALFPSIMFHGTSPFPAGERLTAAFDFVPT